MSIEINKASDAIGAEISGVDLSMPIESQTVSEIRQAFLDHCVMSYKRHTG